MAETLIGGEPLPASQESKKGDAEKETLKKLAEIKELMEKNQHLSAVVDTEPKKVLVKTYIEGTPNQLKNLLSTMISNYGFDSKGNNMERNLAVTLMVEDITPKK